MQYTLILLASIVLSAEPQAPGTLVDVDEDLAKNLLRRGKARVPTEDELRAAGREVPNEDDASDPGAGGGTKKPSEGLTVKQLKQALKDKSVTIPAECNTRDELAALLDSQPAA